MRAQWVSYTLIYLILHSVRVGAWDACSLRALLGALSRIVSGSWVIGRSRGSEERFPCSRCRVRVLLLVKRGLPNRQAAVVKS